MRGIWVQMAASPRASLQWAQQRLGSTTGASCSRTERFAVGWTHSTQRYTHVSAHQLPAPSGVFGSFRSIMLRRGRRIRAHASRAEGTRTPDAAPGCSIVLPGKGRASAGSFAAPARAHNARRVAPPGCPSALALAVRSLLRLRGVGPEQGTQRRLRSAAEHRRVGPSSIACVEYERYAALRVRVEGGVAFATIDHPPINLLDGTLIVRAGPRLAAKSRTTPRCESS